MSNKKKIISNSFWQILYSVLRLLISFFATLYLARKLSVEDFGKLQYMISIQYILQIIELIVHPSIVKDLLVNRNPDKHNAIMGSSFLISLSVLSISLIIVSLLSFYLFDNTYYQLAFILTQVGLMGRSFNNISYYFDSILESKKSSSSQALGVTIASIGKIAVVAITPSIIYQGFLFSSQFLLTTIFNIQKYCKNSSIFNWKLDTEIAKYIIKNSIPLLFTAISAIIFLRIDVVMLEYLSDSSNVAKYSMTVKLSEPWHFISSAIITSFFPIILKSYKDNRKQYETRLLQLNSALIFIGVSISLATFLLADYFVPFLLSKEYLEVSDILKIHIFSLPFLFLHQAQHIWEVSENRLKFALVKSIFAALLNVGLNFILIEKMGAIGAAYATLLSYIFVGVLFNLTRDFSRKYLILQFRSLNINHILKHIK